jgi:hypothetical protein
MQALDIGIRFRLARMVIFCDGIAVAIITGVARNE